MLLEELRTFVAVVDCKNFTRAGKALNLAQPTVSLHIKNLESALHVPLLVRRNKTFHITQEGQLLYERAMQLLQLAAQTKEDLLSLHDEVSGMLRVAASYTIGESILPDVLTRLRAKYPNLHVEVSIGNTVEVETAVRELRADLGCVEGSVEAKELIVEPFMTDELLVVAASKHPLAQQERVTTDDLQNAHWIMREKGSGTRQYSDYLLRSIGQRKPSYTVIGSNEGVKQAVLSGLGIAAISVHTAKRPLGRGEIVPLNCETIPLKRSFSILRSPLSDEKKHISAFIEELHAYCALWRN